MKKNNYVQQLWADNPVFIVWKKIPLSMKLLLGFYVLTTATPNVL